jgi:hypothetical protein
MENNLLNFNLMALDKEKSRGEKHVMLEFMLWKDSVGTLNGYLWRIRRNLEIQIYDYVLASTGEP